MAGIGGGELASAVSRSGGFGFIGAGHSPISFAQEQLPLARGEAVGLGFIAWRLEELDRAEALQAIDQVQVVWFAFGRRIGEWTRAAKKGGKIVFVLVTSVEEAEATKGFGADVLVVQGITTLCVLLLISSATDKMGLSRFRGRWTWL
jgi:NAD(P)H-dependent flavin oxidoreductase YrpB (nitropropane dioxygenase family)